MREKIARRVGATSVVALLVLAGLFIGGVSIAWAAISVNLYDTIETDAWAIQAPGPSGVAYNVDNNTMFVVDTDRNNYSVFDGDGIDLWEISLDGTVLRTGALPTDEPTGVDYDPVNNVLYVSSDADGGVYVISLGMNASFDTSDTDTLLVLDPGHSMDIEDPALDPNGDLYVLNGDSAELIQLTPGPGGFTGGDFDLVDTISLTVGPDNFEGMTFNPAGDLLVADGDGGNLYVANKNTGQSIQTISLTGILPSFHLGSGLGVSPSAGGPGYDIWIADRQDSSPHGAAQIDGRLWRLSTNGTPPPTTTTSSTSSTSTTTTTTQPTTTTTQATTTTTQATTTTTAQGTTTTTAQGTTTTTQGTTTTTAQGTTTTTQGTTTTTTSGTTTTTTTQPPPPPPPPGSVTFAAVQSNAGLWKLYKGATVFKQFYYGNPGDYAFMGDWNCDGVDTPGLYRRSDGYVYLRNTNTQGIANKSFFFGNPGDLPMPGDFDNDGCDTVSIYRPSEGKFYIMNHLGAGDAGLGAADYAYFYGNPGDAPFMGDWNGDGIDTPGLRRNSNGFVYLRNTNTQGNANISYFYGNAGDVVFTGDWDKDGDDTLGLYRPSTGNVYLRNTNNTGVANHTINVGTGKQADGGNF